MATEPAALRVFAPAKINLSLHVTGQRADGYHLLDSLVVFADFGDELICAPADQVSLQIEGPFADGLNSDQDNLILRAARCFAREAGQGAAITLVKNLPVASGIGGGSADAAAALRGLAQMWGLPLPNADTVLGLGADVPVCLAGVPQRMRGIGEDVTPLTNWPDLAAILVNPGVGVSTPEVFRALRQKNNPACEEVPDQCKTASGALAWLADQRNDLEAPARALVPQVGVVLDALRGQGAKLARMSGSGATCFGVFESGDNAQRVAAELQGAQPEWWVQAVTLHGC